MRVMLRALALFCLRGHDTALASPFQEHAMSDSSNVSTAAAEENTTSARSRVHEYRNLTGPAAQPIGEPADDLRAGALDGLKWSTDSESEESLRRLYGY